MTEVTRADQRHLDTWKEGDPDQRRVMHATARAQDGSHLNPRATAHAHDDISALLDALRSRFPGRVFQLVGDADGYRSACRFPRSLFPSRAKNRSPSSSPERAHDG